MRGRALFIGVELIECRLQIHIAKFNFGFEFYASSGGLPLEFFAALAFGRDCLFLSLADALFFLGLDSAIS